MRYDPLRRVLVVMVLGLLALPTALFAQLPSSDTHEGAATSHVRVVRLSYASGDLTVKRPDSSEWEKALVNTPLQEGFELRTSGNSYAEVEFENGSTARFGELSAVTFNQLALDAQGDKLNRLTFERGYATFHFLPENHDVYSVKIADATLTPEGRSEFRTDFAQGRMRIEVFHGLVRVVTPSKFSRLAEDKVLEYNPEAPAEGFKIRSGIVTDDWDKWTEARDKQAQLALRDESVKSKQGLYGWSDLDTYGEWANIPGRGYGWAPYAQAGWSPFSMGMWNWYPAFGWTWISSEPWGWLPYHCGFWDFDDAFGWYWMPMGGCGFWQPALVSWFVGPGWIGWCPRGWPGHPGPVRPRPVRPGPGPHPGFSNSGMKYVTTVPTKVLQNRQMITAQVVSHVGPTEGTFIQNPSFGPATPVALPAGPPRSGESSRNNFSSAPAGARPVVSAARTGPAIEMPRTPAPATILMGGDAAKESALLHLHEHGLSRQPLRAAAGPTLGGQFAMLGPAVGEFRGNRYGAARSFGWAAPIVLAHGRSASAHMRAGGTISGGHGGHSGGGGGHVGGGFGGGHFGGGGHSGGGGGHH